MQKFVVMNYLGEFRKDTAEDAGYGEVSIDTSWVPNIADASVFAEDEIPDTPKGCRAMPVTVTVTFNF